MERIPVTPAEVLRAVEDVLLSLAQGASVNPTKLSFETPGGDGVVYAMTGYDAATRTVGFKNSYRFGAHGEHAAMRYHVTLALYDDRTGLSLGLVDAQHIGAMRTPAVTALFARTAKPRAKTALVVGSGAQAQLATPFLVEACPTIERTMIFGTHQSGLASAVKALSSHDRNRNLEVVTDLAKAAREADIVVGASGPRCAEFVRAADLKNGAIAILVGYGLHSETLHSADYRIATHAGQMKVTGADLANEKGELPEIDAELPDILSGHARPRLAESDKVFAYNSGLVVTDIAVGRLLVDRVTSAGALRAG
ncbi:MAG: ornithine cyclodeaminase family protein [Clostridia bacterium]|nr:ornithine cyclodeaminase family protein [Deltaproteobacteria bacterium]